MNALTPLHGGQLRQIADRFGIPASDLLDFSANINPDGPPAAVISCIRKSLDTASILTDYPDLDETELRQNLAHYAGVRRENIAVANGFVPLLEAALRALSIRNCLVPAPAFVEYRKVLERSGVGCISHGLDPRAGFTYEVRELIDGPHDAILLANPQNPSGVVCPRKMALRIVEEAAQRNVVVLLDEAFIDYCPEISLAKEIESFPNLIVFRSVTKFFGMAGLRVAYAVANIELCRRFQDTLAPWSVTSLASLAFGQVVLDEGYARRSIALNKERREKMQQAIRKLSIHVYPSAANFLLLRLPDAIDGQPFWQRLISKHHIVLRNCANYEGLGDEHLRAAVRTDAENERLIKALAHEVEKEQ